MQLFTLLLNYICTYFLQREIHFITNYICFIRSVSLLLFRMGKTIKAPTPVQAKREIVCGREECSYQKWFITRCRANIIPYWQAVWNITQIAHLNAYASTRFGSSYAIRHYACQWDIRPFFQRLQLRFPLAWLNFSLLPSTLSQPLQHPKLCIVPAFCEQYNF